MEHMQAREKPAALADFSCKLRLHAAVQRPPATFAWSLWQATIHKKEATRCEWPRFYRLGYCLVYHFDFDAAVEGAFFGGAIVVQRFGFSVALILQAFSSDLLTYQVVNYGFGASF
jgi:hypothetical protein